jgi:hypothetical protein
MSKCNVFGCDGKGNSKNDGNGKNFKTHTSEDFCPNRLLDTRARTSSSLNRSSIDTGSRASSIPNRSLIEADKARNTDTQCNKKIRKFKFFI